MASVIRWAALHSVTYRRVDDPEFFGVVPGWVRDKCREWINPVTDLARLLLARRLLSEYEVVIWVDADVLIWAPAHLAVPRDTEAAFSAERWMERWPDGTLRFRDNVSNYVCAFTRGGSFLDRHLADVVEAIRTAPVPVKLGAAGTNLLTQVYSRDDFSLIDNVANISPVLAEALLHRATTDIAAFESGLPVPPVAANLCLSHADRPFQGRDPHPEAVPALVTALLRLGRPLWPSELSVEVGAGGG
jgi:hypothetical protein